MHYYYVFFNFVMSIIVYPFVLFVTLDFAITNMLNMRNINLKNRYYQFHKKAGFGKANVLKSVVTVIVVYLIYNPPPRLVGLIEFVIVHAIIVMGLTYDFIKYGREKEVN